MPDDTNSPAAKGNTVPWDSAYSPLIQGNQQALARWVRVLVELTQEVAQFTQQRLHEDMAAWSALAACRKPEEFFECNRRFTAAAADQYSAEFRKLSELVTRAASEALIPPQVAQASGHTPPRARA